MRIRMALLVPALGVVADDAIIGVGMNFGAMLWGEQHCGRVMVDQARDAAAAARKLDEKKFNSSGALSMTMMDDMSERQGVEAACATLDHLYGPDGTAVTGALKKH